MHIYTYTYTYTYIYIYPHKFPYKFLINPLRTDRFQKTIIRHAIVTHNLKLLREPLRHKAAEHVEDLH